jgi:hypothetical protein
LTARDSPVYSQYVRLSLPCFALVVAFCAACPGENDDAGDSGSADVFDAGVADVGLLPGSCLCETQEDCAGCIEHIGTCCYEDQTIGNEAPNIAAACERTPACKVCCNECKAKSCAELKANGECPNLGRQP